MRRSHSRRGVFLTLSLRGRQTLQERVAVVSQPALRGALDGITRKVLLDYHGSAILRMELLQLIRDELHRQPIMSTVERVI